MFEIVIENLKSQVKLMERDFKQIESRINGVDEYIATRLVKINKLIVVMKHSNWTKLISIVIDLLDEVEMVLNKIQELEEIITPEKVISIEEIGEI